MNKPMSNEITLMQYILTINGIQIGGSILVLPAELARTTGTDGWISIIIAWIITTLVSICIVQVMAKHPGDTLIQVLTHYIGKWPGRVCLLIWIAYSLLAVTSLLYFTVLVVRVWILPGTSTVWLVFLLLVPTYMILRGGVRVMVRYVVFVFFFTLTMPILLTIPIKDAHAVFLLPILKDGWFPIFYAIKTTILAFVGFELAFLLYPYLKNKQHAVKGIVLANTLTLIVYLHITFVCFLYFSPDEITKYLWPVLTLVKPIQLPFLERFEIVFLSFYIFIFSTSGIPYTFSVTHSISQLFNKENWQLPVYIVLLLSLFFSFFYKPSYSGVEAIRHVWGWTVYFIAYAFPVALFLYVTIYGYWKRRVYR
ncbi:GerAB/ArcD/ProY family transporter [Aneurinibacillus aneurinilyticus]|jgi:spore germination protein (amino acid permease)|uniref:Endospore germination permease n=2 Tax=Aneurinibacillus aneurinilyticus TaxID=1391 RepID=A0A848D0Q2_ANEAE|nr:endospore germination permease [Aneurinibacillus aneurinilyticus]ERI05529.1 spore germination protein [Aneurinibacillus aneurinilyticus ATCC 12856]MCI1695538.1 endospore germination permease [Aneurinibacillus aneurinilyticus]MED0673061.1 endospore germination permease [Aneurinibacillus aneurinilyticus]MED0706937.1 endospore germination permease [Aneurinibacillus aneurinilyticus]MED0721975.1 endospore germination permease [Aneurinibacillus aneurinilyticus]